MGLRCKYNAPILRRRSTHPMDPIHIGAGITSCVNKHSSYRWFTLIQSWGWDQRTDTRCNVKSRVASICTTYQARPCEISIANHFFYLKKFWFSIQLFVFKFLFCFQYLYWKTDNFSCIDWQQNSMNSFLTFNFLIIYNFSRKIINFVRILFVLSRLLSLNDK